MANTSRVVFLEIEAEVPRPPGVDQLIVIAPVPALLPLFACPYAWIIQDPVTGRAQVMLQNGTPITTTEKYVNLRGRLIQHAQVIRTENRIES